MEGNNTSKGAVWSALKTVEKHFLIQAGVYMTRMKGILHPSFILSYCP